MKSFATIIVWALGSCFVDAQYPPPAAPAPATPAPQQQLTQDQLPESPPPAHMVLRIVGSQVRNPSGEGLGRIEEILVNRTSGAIEYAVLAPSFPTNDSRLVPLPWSILTYAWDQSRAGGPPGANQVFIANLEPERLAKAPTLDRNRTAGVDPALALANNYFGTGTGGTGAGSGIVSGTGSGQPVVAQPTVPAAAAPGTVETTGNSGQPFYVPGATYPGFVFVGTNGFPTNATSTNVTTTNVTTTNVVGTPSTGTNNGVTFRPGSGPPYTPFPGPQGSDNVVTNPAGPSGPSAGVGPPVERSQGVPQTPVQQSPRRSTAPATATPPGR